MVVLLTGGGSGIGLKATEMLLEIPDTAVAVLTLFSTPELSKLQETYGKDRLLIITGDVTIDEVNTAAVETTVSKFGPLTKLVICVGTMQPVEPIRSLSLAGHRKTFAINYFSVVCIVQAALPSLLGCGGTIGIISSGVDKEVLYRGWSGYCDSKAALTRFINVLAHEEPEIKVFGLLPGVTKSPMVDLIMNGTYDNVMLEEEKMKFINWEKEGVFDEPEWPAKALVKGVLGETDVKSGEVRYWNKF